MKALQTAIEKTRKKSQFEFNDQHLRLKRQ